MHDAHIMCKDKMGSSLLTISDKEEKNYIMRELEEIVIMYL